MGVISEENRDQGERTWVSRRKRVSKEGLTFIVTGRAETGQAALGVWRGFSGIPESCFVGTVGLTQIKSTSDVNE
jgi:hypothetical protein